MLHHNVYVLELEPTVLYVGMTGKAVPDRINDHKQGHRSSRVVRRYANTLRRRSDLEPAGPHTYEDALKLEASHAEVLRGQGFTVHGGH